MSASLHHEVTAPAALGAARRDAMFALFEKCYDRVTRAAFDADLADKTSVILLLDAEEQIRGFSTQRVSEHTWRGGRIRVLFSGDTIVDPACWGSPELAKGWCEVAARALEATPRLRLFWFLISKGHRTYHFLPLFFRRFHPSPAADATEEETALLHHLAAEKFGAAYHADSGLVRFAESRGQLTPDLAEVPAGKRQDPHISYFLQRNPGYRAGEELACLAEVTLANTRGPGARWLARAVEAAQQDEPAPAGESSWRAAAANTLWRALCEPARRRLARALRDPAAAQSAVLRRLLTAGADTAFARSRGLRPDMSLTEYRAAVPVSDYAAHEPLIRRVMQGENDVLFPGAPDAFERSSGSTSAAKHLPLTPALRREFQEAVRAWMGDLFLRHPAAARGPAWWVISPPRQPREFTPGGVPVGLADDAEYLGPLERRLAAWVQAVPPAIARLGVLDENLDWSLRFLLQRPDLRLISVWNPSFLTLLWSRFLEKRETLFHQLASGTGPGDQPFLTCHLRARPDLAAALRGRRHLTPRHVWPRLAVVSGWADGEAAPDAARARALFSHAVFQPKGLLATEGVLTVPWAHDALPGVPALHSHWLEFQEDGDGPVRLVHELDEGGVYSVILTTGGGLWRYRLGDLVRAGGRVENTPRLRFTGRGDDVCDLRGEKLHPAFVRAALHPLVPGFLLLAPCREAEPPHYILFTNTPGVPPDAIDRALSANPHYAHARGLRQLAAVRVFHLTDPDPAAAFLRRCAALGQRPGTVKATSLHRASGWENHFTGAFASTASPP